jgi:hypothetical protein
MSHGTVAYIQQLFDNASRGPAGPLPYTHLAKPEIEEHLVNLQEVTLSAIDPLLQNRRPERTLSSTFHDPVQPHAMVPRFSRPWGSRRTSTAPMMEGGIAACVQHEQPRLFTDRGSQ